MRTKHDGSGLVYPMSDAVNVSGFKSRTSHFFMLDFGDLSTNSAFARKFVYKHQIFVYIGSYVCLQRISTAKVSRYNITPKGQIITMLDWLFICISMTCNNNILYLKPFVTLDFVFAN